MQRRSFCYSVCTVLSIGIWSSFFFSWFRQLVSDPNLASWSWVLQATFFSTEELSVNVTVEPNYGCVCPRQSYTCRAYPVSQMSWTVVTNPTDQVVYNIFNFDQFKIDNISRNGLQYTFSENRTDDAAVITSELLIIAPHRNETNATCSALKDNNRNFDTVVACITGKMVNTAVTSL